MNYSEMIKVAKLLDESYDGDNAIEGYFRNSNYCGGDTLAEFIAHEIRSTTEGEDSLGCLLSALTRACEQLERVREAVQNIA